MTTGIYKITHVASGRHYIGSSFDVQSRWRKHKSELVRGVHHSEPLQRAWNKYGAEGFSFEVLEITERDNILSREQHWMDLLRAVIDGFNILPIAGNCAGRRHSEEARQRMSERQRGRKLSPEFIARRTAARLKLGLKTSEETKEKLRLALTGKPKSAQMRENSRAARRRDNWRPSQACRDASRKALLGKKFSPEVIAKRVATRAANKALRQAAQGFTK